METKQKCACCGNITIEHIFSICPVCYWQNDFFQEEIIDDNSGPNTVSLRDAKINYSVHGVIEERFREYIREPFLDEIP